MTGRLQKIDTLLLHEHPYLRPEDNCYFFGEYTPYKGFEFSPTNSLILNLKKEPSRKGRIEWQYKEDAIQKVAGMLMSISGWGKMGRVWIPIPPSKSKLHENYDDRLIRVLDQMKMENEEFDFRDLVSVETDRDGAHNLADGARPSPADHLNNYRIDEDLIEPQPSSIVIFDDLITTGSSFKAMETKLVKIFGADIPVYGIFVARRRVERSIGEL